MDEKEILELFEDPVKWCEAFLRNPNNKEESLVLRSYQKEVLSQTRKYRNIILRYGRRLGKSVTMCCDTLWWCAAYPLVRMLHGETKRQIPFRVIIATPYDTQITELWNTYTCLIADSPLLKNLVVKIRASDPQIIQFDNGSTIEGHTIGISSSNKGTSLRSLSADMIFLDEMDFIPREIVEQVIMPIWTTHTSCRLRVCSTPSGQRSLFWEWCLTENTKVNTEDGLKSIAIIEPGELVFGQNGSLEKVTATYKRQYKGNIHVITTGCGVIEATPNHPLYVYNKGFVNAADITKEDYILIPKQHYDFKPITLDLNNIYQKDELKIKIFFDEFMKRNGTAKIFHLKAFRYKKLFDRYGDIWCFDNEKRKNIRKARRFIDIINKSVNDDEFMRNLFCFIGYYLACGSTFKMTLRKIKDHYCGIYFAVPLSKAARVDDITKVIRYLLPQSRILIRKNKKIGCLKIIVRGIWIAYVVLTLVNEKSKKLHNSLLHFNKYTSELMDAYASISGCVMTNGLRSYATRSDAIFQQLYSIMINHNIPALYKYKSIRKNRPIYVIYQVNKPDLYKIAAGNIYARVRNITIKDYSGYVYNLETDTTHTYNISWMCSHNCTRAQELGWLHIHYPSWHPDNPNWLSIEEARKQGKPISESTEFQVKAITDSATYEREYGAEFGEEFGGVYKQALINKSLCKYGRNIDLSNPDLFDPGFKQVHGNIYIIGVDWNSYINGGQVVVLEYCKSPTYVTYFDDELKKDVTINFTGKYRLFYRRGIKSKEATQRKTREEIIRLLRTLKIDYIYVDYGAGDTNIEELSLYGKDHPELHMDKKLRVVDSGANTEHYDPILKKTVKKRNKSLMVSLSVLNLEEGLYCLPKEEDEKKRLVGQMRGYTIKSVTVRGDYTYDGEDHILDAFNLAVYGFHKEYGSILSSKYVYDIFVINDPRVYHYPERVQNVKTIFDNTISNIVDPEKVTSQRRFIKPRFIKQPFRRRNIDTHIYGRQTIY